MPHLHLTDIPSRDDMLAAIKDFLVANGWTLDLWTDATGCYSRYGSNPSGKGKRLHIHHGPFYVHMRSATRQQVYTLGDRSRSGTDIDGDFSRSSQLTGIAMYPATGFDSVAPWDQQPGGPYRGSPAALSTTEGSAGVLMRVPPGVIPSCHIFVEHDPYFLLIAVEYAVGRWRHVLACDVHPFEKVEGGLFAGGTGCLLRAASPLYYNNRFLGGEIGQACMFCPPAQRADASGWIFPGYGLRTESIHDEYAGRGVVSEPLLSYSAPTFSGVHPLIPYYVSTYADDETLGGYILGQLPHFRLTLASAYTPEQVIQVGDKRWLVLPVSDAKNPHAIAVRYDGD